MIFLAIALIFMLAIAVLAFRIKSKRWYSQDHSLEKKLVAVFAVLAVLSVLTHFFIPQDLAQIISPPAEGIDSKILAETVSPVEACGEEFCFDVKVTRVFKGLLADGQNIPVVVDCGIPFFGELEIVGKARDGKLFSSCTKISMIDPLIEEGFQ